MDEHSFENQLSIHVESTDLTVAPGSSMIVPAFLHKYSAADEFFELAVRGIPSKHNL